MILVVGATGLPGSEIGVMLRAADQPVRGLIRSHEKVEALNSAGVATGIADLKDPGSISRACDGGPGGDRNRVVQHSDYAAAMGRPS